MRAAVTRAARLELSVLVFRCELAPACCAIEARRAAEVLAPERVPKHCGRRMVVCVAAPLALLGDAA